MTNNRMTFFGTLFSTILHGAEKKLTFAERLEAIGFPVEVVPDEFCCLIKYTIMENPVRLVYANETAHTTGANIIDQSAFLFLKKDKSNHLIDPFRNVPIERYYADDETKERIEKFVATQEEIARSLQESGTSKKEIKKIFMKLYENFSSSKNASISMRYDEMDGFSYTGHFF